MPSHAKRDKGIFNFPKLYTISIAAAITPTALRHQKWTLLSCTSTNKLFETGKASLLSNEHSNISNTWSRKRHKWFDKLYKDWKIATLQHKRCQLPVEVAHQSSLRAGISLSWRTWQWAPGDCKLCYKENSMSINQHF